MRLVAERLERGRLLPLTLGQPAAAIWARVARPERELRLPARARVVGVGGATLGGSGCTPLAIAVAESLAQSGERVAFVSHGYRASWRRWRQVEITDSAALVGDEALLAARRLAAHGVSVSIGPRRQAIERASHEAGVVVVDGLLQTRPVRLAYSILSVDQNAPWGAGHCPPRGDLRAQPDRLLAAADVVCAIDCGDPCAERSPQILRVPARSTLLGFDGQRSWGQLHGRRVGVVLAIARPQRVLAQLARRGVTPVVVRLAADHGRPSTRPGDRQRVDVWLTTEKCFTKLGWRLAGREVWCLRQELDLPGQLLSGALRTRDF